MLFQYASTAHVRRHGPTGYLNYQSFKPWLRDEFTFRCVYCLARETWYPNGADGFGVDHQKPTTRHPELECEYANLLYACNRCNSWKQHKNLIDPTRTGFEQHLRVRRDGVIEGLTTDGVFFIKVLELDQDEQVAFRKKTMDLYEALDGIPEGAELLKEFFGYPRDMPDLESLRAPGGNTRPAGAASSFYNRAAAGQLADWY